jgi:fatty-acyl-CoA synthase
MKLAFSTLGCPDFDWSDIYSIAKDFGFSGIEVRGLGNDIFSVRAQPFLPGQVGETIAHLKRLNLEIPCLSSGLSLNDPARAEEARQELKEYIELASRLGTPYIRVLGDQAADVTGEVDDEVVLASLCALAPLAQEAGVTLLVETNGVYADTSRLFDLLNRVKSDAVGARWDIHQPYRYMNEKPEKTGQNLGSYIKHTHIKDSVMENGKVVYKLMGEGDLPIEEIIRALRSINFEGYISLEWLKRYAPDLSDAGIVFPHYANFMSQFGREPPKRTPVRQQQKNRQICVAQGAADRPDLSADFRQDRRRVSRSVRISVHNGRLYAYLC